MIYILKIDILRKYSQIEFCLMNKKCTITPIMYDLI